MKAIKNDDDYNEVINQKKPILLDFYADWCGPCQSLLPIVEKLAKEYKGEIEIRKVNVDENPSLANKYRVRNIPALYFIKDQVIVDKIIGLGTEVDIKNKLNKLIE